MPQFPLRLPSRNEAALIGLALLALLFASWLRRGEKIASLEAALAAKPLVEEHRAMKEEKGPVTRHRTFGPPPAPTAACPNPRAPLLEETISRGPVKREEVSDRKETPICPAPYRPKTRYVRATWDPAEGFLPRAGAAGLTWADRVDTGASYDRVYKAVGLELGARF